MRESYSANDFYAPQQNDERKLSPHSAPISRRSSFKLSINSFRKILLFAPLSRHKCCLGCVSLRGAVPLICLIEIILLAFSLMFAMDFWVNDGILFFTHELEGKGRRIAIVFAICIVLSAGVIFITLFAWHWKRQELYALHTIWQVLFVTAAFYFTYQLVLRIFVYRQDESKRIMIPSAITIALVVCAVGLCELWWLFIFVDAVLHERKGRESKQSRVEDADNFNEGKPTSNLPLLIINDGEST